MTLASSRISLSVLSGIRTAQPQWCNGTNCHLRYRASYLQFALSWFRYAKVHYFNIKQHWKIPLTARQRIAAKNSEKGHCLWIAYEEVPQDLQCRNMYLCVCVHSLSGVLSAGKQILQTLRRIPVSVAQLLPDHWESSSVEIWGTRAL